MTVVLRIDSEPVLVGRDGWSIQSADLAEGDELSVTGALLHPRGNAQPMVRTIRMQTPPLGYPEARALQDALDTARQVTLSGILAGGEVLEAVPLAAELIPYPGSHLYGSVACELWVVPWSPLDLFARGEQGAWYDPSDLSTLFQDAEGTVAVTGPDQPVGRILDKSPNGNHATQSAEASKPILRTDGSRWWLEFDGVDDRMGMAVDLTATAAALLGSASRDVSTGGTTRVAISPGTTNYLGTTNSLRRTFTNEAELGTSVIILPSIFEADQASILRWLPGTVDISNSHGLFTFEKGVSYAGRNYQHLGAYNTTSNFWYGRIYAALVRGGVTTDTDRTLVEGYLAARAGAPLL